MILSGHAAIRSIDKIPAVSGNEYDTSYKISFGTGLWFNIEPETVL